MYQCGCGDDQIGPTGGLPSVGQVRVQPAILASDGVIEFEDVQVD